MYYKERIIGVITYGILMLIFSFLIRSDENNTKKILFIYAFVLSLLAFFYIPNPGYDLERIYLSFSNKYSVMSQESLIMLLKKSYTPITVVFYYIVSKSGVYGLAPSICSFVFYICVFTVLNDIIKKYNILGIKKSLFLIFIMCLGTYLEIISNLRTMTSFAIIFYCFYREIANNKSVMKHIPLYIIASSTHLVSLVVTIIRFAIYPLQKKKWKLFYSLLPISLLIIIYFFFPSTINQIFYTDSYYKTYVEYAYLPEYILMTIMTIYIIVIKLLHYKTFFKDNELKMFNIFAIILLFIMIINFSEYTIYHRLGTLHFLLNLPIIGKYISLLKKRSGMFTMFLISCIILFIAGCFGNLCGFKYFIFG